MRTDRTGGDAAGDGVADVVRSDGRDGAGGVAPLEHAVAARTTATTPSRGRLNA
jgi:hypothetical protein